MRGNRGRHFSSSTTPSRDLRTAAATHALLRKNSLMALCNQVIVLGMRSDPEPQDAIGHVYAEGAIVQAHAHRSESTDALEAKGGVRRIGLEELEALVGQGANSLR